MFVHGPPTFDVLEESKKLITSIWLNTKFLPIELHIPEILIALGNSLGRTVALDARNTSHAHQVRICSEVDLSLQLPDSIWVNKRQYQVTFENTFTFLSYFSSPSPPFHSVEVNAGEPPIAPLTLSSSNLLFSNLNSNFILAPKKFKRKNFKKNNKYSVLSSISEINSAPNHLLQNALVDSSLARLNHCPRPHKIAKLFYKGNFPSSTPQVLISKSGKSSVQQENLHFSSSRSSPALSDNGKNSTQISNLCDKKSSASATLHLSSPSPQTSNLHINSEADIHIILDLDRSNFSPQSSTPPTQHKLGSRSPQRNPPQPKFTLTLKSPLNKPPKPKLPSNLSKLPCPEPPLLTLLIILKRTPSSPWLMNQSQPYNYLRLAPMTSQITNLKLLYLAPNHAHLEVGPQIALIKLRRDHILIATLTQHPLLIPMDVAMSTKLNLFSSCFDHSQLFHPSSYFQLLPSLNANPHPHFSSHENN